MSENSHIWCTYADPEKSNIQKFQIIRVLVPDLFPQGKETFNNTLLYFRFIRSSSTHHHVMMSIILELFHGYENKRSIDTVHISKNSR